MPEAITSTIENTESTPVNPVLEEMAKAGVLYGRIKSKSNPKMASFVQTVRNGVQLIDLSLTLEALEKAEKFLKETVEKGGAILFVGTQPAAKDAIKSIAVKFGYPSVTNRWLGGTLTNHKTLSGRINHFIKLKEDRVAGRLEKYTKKERLMFDREIARMEKLFGGLEKMNQLPVLLVIVDAKLHDTAVREAIRVKVPVVALVNTDADPDIIDYLIPANTSAKLSVEWILNRLAKSIEDGKNSKPIAIG